MEILLYKLCYTCYYVDDMNTIQTDVLIKKETQVRNMLRNTFAWMTIGLLLTSLVSWICLSSQAMLTAISRSPGLIIFAFLLQIGLVFYLSLRIMRLRASSAALLFLFYSALNGVTLSLILQMYTQQSIVNAFLSAAASFGGAAIYAASTKRNLSGIGHYLVMGLWGLIAASLLNMFLRSGPFSLLISIVGVVIFIGLTAYDTQVIKQWSDQYSDVVSDQDYGRLSILGALKLYLDFINIFIFFLRIFGSRR